MMSASQTRAVVIRKTIFDNHHRKLCALATFGYIKQNFTTTTITAASRIHN
ncbi:MAG TPA: hypothetical protein VE573_16015 [Nitrososphaeraceae archaeon]|nr:hypothetical protein [Nitrososphaeraceae archaeon]